MSKVILFAVLAALFVACAAFRPYKPMRPSGPFRPSFPGRRDQDDEEESELLGFLAPMAAKYLIGKIANRRKDSAQEEEEEEEADFRFKDLLKKAGGIAKEAGKAYLEKKYGLALDQEEEEEESDLNLKKLFTPENIQKAIDIWKIIRSKKQQQEAPAAPAEGDAVEADIAPALLWTVKNLPTIAKGVEYAAGKAGYAYGKWQSRRDEEESEEEADLNLKKFFTPENIQKAIDIWKIIRSKKQQQQEAPAAPAEGDSEEADQSWPQDRCTNVQDSLNVRDDKAQLTAEKLGPETKVTVWATQTMNGETFAKIGNNRWVAARFLKLKCDPAPAGTDCGEAYESGTFIGRKQCITIDGKPVVTTTAAAYNKMKAAAASAGVSLRINSGFRTQKEQQYFYNCYVTGSCNNGNLAAKPGYSNHQNGLALDIDVTSDKTYNWLRNNGSKYGFVRTVASEEWHWEYRPNSRCNSFVSYSCQ